MSDVVEPSATSRVRQRWLAWLFTVDMISTLLLGIGALATSWSSYQATRWSGVQAEQYSRAGGLRVESTRASTLAGQHRAIDLFMFTAWLTADVESRPVLTEFYHQRFRPEFKPAFDEWLTTKPRTNTDAPTSPFVLPAYRLADQERAATLLVEAERASQAAGDANEQSDQYVLTGVLFAMVLFLAGIATHAKRPPATWALLGMAGVVCLGALITLARFPIE